MSFASGRVAPELEAEFPGLRLWWTAIEVRAGPAPRELRRRLRALSDRVAGAGVVAMRTRPIPHAYRVFFRQVGLDPDAARIPSEEAAVRRLLQGRFHSRGLLADARLIALIETGVPVWALDAGLVAADSLEIRTSVSGERLGGGAFGGGVLLPAGQLVVADALRVHAMLFGEPAPGYAPGRGDRRIVLYAVAVEGVPAIHVEEALWICTDALGAGEAGPGAGSG
jgi:DNA/RNA-binding domain of Phe-tRNA-synthetase-like protein